MQDVSLIISDWDFIRLMAMQPTPELRSELERAIVVPLESMRPDVVAMESLVCYRDFETDALRQVEIVYPEEADPAFGKVSVLAPVGAALIGLGEGQAIDWAFPDGKTRRLAVVAVRQKAPATSALLSPQH